MKLNTVYIFVNQYPFDCKTDNIYPQERLIEINNCLSDKIKNQKFYAWKLLEYAIQKVLNKDISEFRFKKVKSKWVCDDFCFSISHSGNLVAIAVALNPVGVDIEKINIKRFEKLSKAKFLTPKEMTFEYSAENLVKAWTIKEAVLKKNGRECLLNQIDSLDKDYLTLKLKVSGNFYFLSLACDSDVQISYDLGDGICLI